MCDPSTAALLFTGGIAVGVLGVIVIGWFLLKNTKFN